MPVNNNPYPAANKNRGNILFLILIAVALFAALSYTITSSSRSNDGRISRDKANLLAAEIIQYATQVEQAISKMMIINKVSIEYLDIDDLNGYVVQTPNTNCASNTCKLFNSEGGQISPKLLPKKATNLDATNWAKKNDQSRLHFMIVPVKGVGSEKSELLLLYGAVQQDVCDEINIRLGLHKRGETRLNDTHAAFAAQQGNLIPYPEPTGMLGDEDSRIIGKRTFCVTQANLWGNYFYHVLVAR